jgi:hypothetical protein
MNITDFSRVSHRLNLTIKHYHTPSVGFCLKVQQMNIYASVVRIHAPVPILTVFLFYYI